MILLNHTQVVSRATFYCNLVTGECAWTASQALSQPLASESITVYGEEWEAMQNNSLVKRVFGQYDEMQNPYMDIIFYCDTDMQVCVSPPS